MTHTLHRTGSVESLKGDFPVLIRPSIGINDKGAAAKVQRAMRIVFEVGPDNLGACEVGQTLARGMDPEAVIPQLQDTAGVRFVLSSRDKLKELLFRLKEEDLGLSVTVSGIIEDVFDLCREVGLKPHSVNLSLGVHGNTEELASEQVREFTSMCGHALVASSLVEQVMSDVKAGRRDPREAAVTVALPCACGIFNLDRAERMLRALQPDQAI